MDRYLTAYLKSRYDPFKTKLDQRPDIFHTENIIVADIEVYFGRWSNNFYQGYAELISKNGHIYTGNFDLNKKTGPFTIEYKNGNLFRGIYQNSKKCGDGFYVFKNGAKLVGKFTDGLGNFDGTFTSKDGVFVGKTRNGKFHGFGKYIWANGRTIWGTWVDGFLKGRSEVGPEGEKYVGGGLEISRNEEALVKARCQKIFVVHKKFLGRVARDGGMNEMLVGIGFNQSVLFDGVDMGGEGGGDWSDDDSKKDSRRNSVFRMDRLGL